MEEFKNYLQNEVNNRLQSKLTSLCNYNTDDNPLYLLDDIEGLLNVSSLKHKLPDLLNNLEKMNSVLTVNEVTRMRTLLTKSGVRKIIQSMRKKPAQIILDFFEYKMTTIDVSPSNTYIKRLLYIFSSYKPEAFRQVKIADSVITLDVFFPEQGIIVLFNKKNNLFAQENFTEYYAAQTELLKVYKNYTQLRWIQFTGYDSKSITQFDELIKDLITILSKNICT